MTSRFSRAIVVALVTIATVGLTHSRASADGSYSSSRTFRAMEFNFCGSDCPYPAPTAETVDRAGGATSAKLAEIEAKITRWQPNVVLLNEVCLAQLEQLVVDLSATSWPMDAGPAIETSTTYDGARPPHEVSDLPVGFVAVDHRRTTDVSIPRVGCDHAMTTGARTFGNAVLVVAGTQLSDRLDVAINVDDSGKPRGIQKGLCVTLSDAPYYTHVCLAHTSPDPRVLAPEQITYFYNAVADSYGGSYPAIFAGDLNVRPTSAGLDDLYDPTHDGSGRYREADQCDVGRPERVPICNENTKDNGGDGNTTLNKKIDYVFGNRAYFGVDPSTTTVNRSAYSDHGIFRATMAQCSVFATSGCDP